MVSVLCVPIPVDARIAALVHLESDEPGHFTESHEQLLTPLLQLAGPALGAQGDDAEMTERALAMELEDHQQRLEKAEADLA